MRPLETQELVRELITETDHLSRAWHAVDQHTRSGHFAALRSTFQRIERHMGSESPRFTVVGELDVVYQRIRAMASAVEDEAGREDLERLLSHAERLRSQHEHERSEWPAMASEHRRAEMPRAAFAMSGVAIPLGLCGCIPGLRRSRVAWGIAVALAAASLGLSVAGHLRRMVRRVDERSLRGALAA